MNRGDDADQDQLGRLSRQGYGLRSRQDLRLGLCSGDEAIVERGGRVPAGEAQVGRPNPRNPSSGPGLLCHLLLHESHLGESDRVRVHLRRSWTGPSAIREISVSTWQKGISTQLLNPLSIFLAETSNQGR